MDNPQIQIVFQLLLAALLGGLVGLEREYKRKEAGLRTYALVSLGSALFTIIAFEAFQTFLGKPGANLDPLRVIQAVAMGIGFIGAGLIIFREKHIEGLTTAAGLWIVAAIGVAVGAKLYFPAIFVALVAIGILAGLRLVEEKIFGKEIDYNPPATFQPKPKDGALAFGEKPRVPTHLKEETPATRPPRGPDESRGGRRGGWSPPSNPRKR